MDNIIQMIPPVNHRFTRHRIFLSNQSLRMSNTNGIRFIIFSTV
jgi:hypothetical protein